MGFLQLIITIVFLGTTIITNITFTKAQHIHGQRQGRRLADAGDTTGNLFLFHFIAIILTFITLTWYISSSFLD